MVTDRLRRSARSCSTSFSPTIAAVPPRETDDLHGDGAPAAHYLRRRMFADEGARHGGRIDARWRKNRCPRARRAPARTSRAAADGGESPLPSAVIEAPSRRRRGRAAPEVRHVEEPGRQAELEAGREQERRGIRGVCRAAGRATTAVPRAPSCRSAGSNGFFRVLSSHRRYPSASSLHRRSLRC